MNVQWFLRSLPIMGKGMLGVFLAILIIYGFVAVLNRISWRDKGNKAA